MTLLSICQDAAPSIGVPKPTVVIGSPVQSNIEFLQHAKTEIFELSQRADWQELQTEKTFTSVATEIQTGMVPADFDRFISDTFWNRSRKRPLTGPMTAQQWQNIKAWSTSPVVDMFRYRGSDILIQPIPPAGDTYAYEYITNLLVLDANGVTAKPTWAADTDTCRMNENIVKYGVIWRYRKQKGLVYDAEFSQYEDAIKNATGGDTPKTIINMANPGAKFSRFPGIIVSSINWPTS